MSPWSSYLLLFGAGCVAGTLNVIAGGGSFLTLPILIFLGLPAGVANGTNRVGILMQNVAAVWSFERDGVSDRRAWLWAAGPATAGGGLGTALALQVSDLAFQRILAFLMVTLALWTLWSPGRGGHATAEDPLRRRRILAAGFFGAGIYAGFIQAGVGFLILAVTTAVGFDLVRGNAVKVLAILCLTVLSLGLFAWQGRVDWILGLSLGAGTVVGGLIGARLTVKKGHRWVRAVVTAAMLIFAVKLWL